MLPVASPILEPYLQSAAAAAASSAPTSVTTEIQRDDDSQDGFVFIEANQSAQPAQAVPRSLTTYADRMHIQHIADVAFALYTTGWRIIEGYKHPDRLYVYLDPTNIPDCFFPTVKWMVDYQGFRLKSQHLTDYLKSLVAASNKKIQVIFETLVLKADTGHTPTYYMKLWELELKHTKAAKPEFLFIPFLYPGHIVMIEVNFVENKLYYYDSQGVPPGDACRCVYEGFNMVVELDKLWKIAFGTANKPQIITNPYVHQQDVHSCGVYCGDYVFRRINGETFDHIILNGKNAAEIEETRVAQALRLSNADPEAIAQV